MLTLILTAICLAVSRSHSFAHAQVVDYNETVLSTVIFVRTGDHTPFFLGTESTKLTSSGARQLYDAGSFFRSRYIFNTDNATVSSQTAAPIAGLATEILDNDQLFFLAHEDNVMLVAAQAFAQGLYPPSPPSSNDSSPRLDSSSILANSSYVSSPLSNYQYVAIGSTNDDDPTSIILSGGNNCPAWTSATNSYSSSAAFTGVTNASQGLFDVVGSEVLNNILDLSEWNYAHAYEIYDYVSYLANHDTTTAAMINSTTYGPADDSGNSQKILPQLRDLASQLLWGINSYDPGTTGNEKGGYPAPILSIAGSTVAMTVLDLLQGTVTSQGSGAAKLSVFVGDHEPFLGFASVSQLASRYPAFQGLPGYSAVMAWELYSVTNASDGNSASFPSIDDLWVRFLFRNGSDDLSSDDNDLISYPLFNRDPDQTEMSWTDFVSLMSSVAVGSVDDWCGRCNSQTLFCLGIGSLESNSTSSGNSNTLSNAVAGVIGAVVTIGVFLILVLLAIVLGGVRFHTARSPLTSIISRSRRGEDTKPTPGPGISSSEENRHESFQSATTAVDGRQVDSERTGIVGHAKAENWELTTIRRPSLDDDERDKLDEMGKPVEARESV